MANKEIDFSKYSRVQLDAARMMSNPDVKLTNKEIADAVGVSERTIYRWKEDREFIELLNDLAERYMDAFLGDVYKQLQKAVSRGSVKGIELALKRSGKLIEKREVSGDVQVELIPIQSKTNQQLLAEVRELERKLMGLPPGQVIDIDAVAVDRDGGEDE